MTKTTTLCCEKNKGSYQRHTHQKGRGCFCPTPCCIQHILYTCPQHRKMGAWLSRAACQPWLSAYALDAAHVHTCQKKGEQNMCHGLRRAVWLSCQTARQRADATGVAWQYANCRRIFSAQPCTALAGLSGPVRANQTKHSAEWHMENVNGMHNAQSGSAGRRCRRCMPSPCLPHSCWGYTVSSTASSTERVRLGRLTHCESR